MAIEEALISATVGTIVGGLCGFGIIIWQVKILHPGIGGEKSIADFLATAIGQHDKAMLLFRAYLPIGQHAAFDIAWNDYNCQDKWNELNRNPISLDYGAVFDITKEKEKRHLVILRIEKLLDFAPLTV